MSTGRLIAPRPHKCWPDTGAVIGTNDRPGDLWKCFACGRWSICWRGYLNDARGDWRLVGWLDFSARRQIRRLEAVDSGACLSTLAVSAALVIGAVGVLLPLAAGDHQPTPVTTTTASPSPTDTSTRLPLGSRPNVRPDEEALGKARPAGHNSGTRTGGATGLPSLPSTQPTERPGAGDKPPGATELPTSLDSSVERARTAAALPSTRRPGGPTLRQWRALAACESGGRPRIVSNTRPRYYGLYQFDRDTWRGTGGRGLPSLATPREQLKRARILHADRGTQPWPQCGRWLHR